MIVSWKDAAGYNIPLRFKGVPSVVDGWILAYVG